MHPLEYYEKVKNYFSVIVSEFRGFAVGALTILFLTWFVFDRKFDIDLIKVALKGDVIVDQKKYQNENWQLKQELEDKRSANLVLRENLESINVRYQENMERMKKIINERGDIYKLNEIYSNKIKELEAIIKNIDRNKIQYDLNITLKKDEPKEFFDGRLMLLLSDFIDDYVLIEGSAFSDGVRSLRKGDSFKLYQGEKVFLFSLKEFNAKKGYAKVSMIQIIDQR